MTSSAPAVLRGSEAVEGFVVDRASPVPLYAQVAQQLELAISSGVIPPGTLVGNEIRLADRLGLSRPTMRRAMQHLVERGLVVRRRGVGTRVVQPKVRRPLELTSLHDDLAAAGQAPTTEVLSFSWIPAAGDVADRLEVQPEAQVVGIVRLRCAAGVPIAKLTNYLPTAAATFGPDDLGDRGLYELLRASGAVLHSATQTIGARTATAGEATLLHEVRGASLLTMQRVAYDDHGKVLEYGTHLYAASRYSFEINLLTS